MDISRHGYFRCCLRILFSRNCCCLIVLNAWRRAFSCKPCKQSTTEKLFDVGREFYTNEISLARIVNTLKRLEELEKVGRFSTSPAKKEKVVFDESVTDFKFEPIP